MVESLSSAGLRHYVGVPFAREVPSDEQDALERALEASAVGDMTDPTRVDNLYGHHDIVEPDRVEVTADYALVEATLAPGADQTPVDCRRVFQGAIRTWHKHHGPLSEPTVLGGATAVGTFPSPALGLGPDRDTVRERLRDATAGESPTAPSRYYILATPDRPVTDDEIEGLQYAVENPPTSGRYAGEVSGDVEPGFLALFGVPRPGGTYTSATGAVRGLLDRTPSRGDDDAHTTLAFWSDQEVGTLGDDLEAGRAAVLDRARNRTATTAGTTQEGRA